MFHPQICTSFSPVYLYIHTHSEHFLHEVIVWTVVFSQSGSGFVSAPAVFAHAVSAVTESYQDFSANAAHCCSSVTILFLFFSLQVLSLILVADVRFGSEVSVVWLYLPGLCFVKVAFLVVFFWTQRTGGLPQYVSLKDLITHIFISNQLI